MATINAKRRDRWVKMKAEWDAVDLRRGVRPSDSRLKIGGKGDRVGWHQSISAEQGKRSSPEEREWRQNVLHRDGHKCVQCGSAEYLEVDHIRPRSMYPELKFNMDNGQTLCHQHHVETETYGVKVRKLVAVETETVT